MNMRLRAIIAGLLAGALCVCAGVAWAQPTREYANKTLNFRMRYPADFTVKPVQGAIIFAAPLKDARDTFSESLNVIAVAAGPALDLKQLYRQGKEKLEEQLKQVKFLEEKQTTVAGVPAYLTVYSSLQKKTRFKFLQLMFAQGRLVYTVTYTALADSYDEYYSRAQAMINSFAFLQ